MTIKVFWHNYFCKVKMTRHPLMLFVCFLWTTAPILGQYPFPQDRISDQTDGSPTVFLIGQNEATYEQMMMDHNTMLLAVCENDMNRAYSKWVDVLTQVEEYSRKVDFDLNGVKLWINIFWNEDGTIEHLVYHPKPNSKNIHTAELTAFFTSFIPNYHLDMNSRVKYSHYGSASFPVHPIRVGHQ